jgi:hypothetical protein
MSDSVTVPPGIVKRVGVAADHGWFELKQELARMLRQDSYEVFDYGNSQPELKDDYPDFVAPLARAATSGEIDRGLAVHGSGVGVCWQFEDEEVEKFRHSFDELMEILARRVQQDLGGKP